MAAIIPMFKWSQPLPHFYEMEFSGDLNQNEQEAFLCVLNRLSNETKPFVVLTVSQGNSPLTPENKKRMNLWFKDNKAFLEKMCLGTVRVQDGFSDDHYQGSNLEKGLPFPIYSRGGHFDGRKLAEKILTAGIKK
ncbi:hypothetical protein [Sneathiella limimaris]|uniref:hypothetical protein n=1 Tax=Sneathiella limimaris TaxID=1964213 RepID=UPI00146EA917|nr:hypothetical protein [Sneathiella limimaris]